MSSSQEFDARDVLRWLLGLVLLWAAVGKLANLQDFFAALLAYRLPLPADMIRGIAIVLPWIELLCGLLLVACRQSPGAMAWALALFAIFAVCTGQAWLRGLNIACGCLDLRLVGIRAGSAAAGWLESVRFAFARSLALAAVALYLLRREGQIQHES
jgi:putative oxidoreductase